VVNGKSAIEWIMERYQVTTHKESGIVNDPNLWCDEHDKPRYIIDLHQTHRHPQRRNHEDRQSTAETGVVSPNKTCSQNSSL
jgi:hypothetical protein